MPCTACYEKHKAEEAALLPPVDEPNFSDMKQAAASLQRIPPPEIPHGHAASAPEDITHHQAHARQLPAPNPPDPRTADSEESGPLLAHTASPRATERERDGAAAQPALVAARAAAEEEPTCCPEEAELVPCSACYEKMHGHHSSPSPASTVAALTVPPAFTAPSAPSPLPTTYALTANAVDYNAGVGTQSLYNVSSAMQQQQQLQPYAMQPAVYSPLTYAASPPPSAMYGPSSMQPQQQVDMYGNLYQQPMSGMQMQQQQQPQYQYQPASAVYQPYPAPVTMAGPNGGTLVYYPNPAQNSVADSSAQPQLQSMPVVQPQPQQISHQMPPPGLMGYYQQPQHQQQVQLAQPQHSAPAQQQPATLAYQQQPVAYVNNIPMYYTTQPPQQQQQQTQSAQSTQHHSVYLPVSAPASTVSSPASSVAGESIRSFTSEADKTCATYKTEICRSHQYSGACEYGASCQFAHGLDELRTREVDPKYKTERCKNYHAFGPSTCWYGPRCKFIHDESVQHSHSTTPPVQ